MGRRIARVWRPGLEGCEPRELRASITDVMSANSLAAAALRSRAAAIGAIQAGALGFSSQSIALPVNQGPLLNPDGTINNQALAPTGTLTDRQLRRERFLAQLRGHIHRRCRPDQR